MNATIQLNVKPQWKVSMGHPAKRGGAGIHADKRWI